MLVSLYQQLSEPDDNYNLLQNNLNFFSRILDFNEFLQTMLELALSNPQLITLHESTPSLESVSSILLNKVTAFEQCFPEVAHMS